MDNWRFNAFEKIHHKVKMKSIWKIRKILLESDPNEDSQTLILEKYHLIFHINNVLKYY
jgi:hypothetical protein